MRLLNFLLNYFLFAGTMFLAAGASAMGEGGGGAGDGASNNGGSDGSAGAESSADSGSDGSGSGEGSSDALAAGAGRAEGEGEGQPDPEAPVDLGDGRTVPSKWNELFKLAKEKGLDRDIKQLYFAQQRLTKALPGGVNQAIKLAQTVEQFGGLPAIEQLKNDIDTYHADAELFENNQAKWIETSFEENADASLKAFSHSLDYVGEHHPEHYNYLMSKVVINTLDDSPIHDIYTALTGLKDNAAAQDLAKQLAGWYNGIKKLASKVPEKQIDPQAKALEQRASELKEQETGLRHNQVNAQTFPHLKAGVANVLQKEAKLAGVDLDKVSAESPGSFRAMMNEIHRRITTQAASDKTFVDNHYAVLQSGNIQRAIAMQNEKHDQIIPDIVRAVAKEWGLLKSTGKKPVAGTGKGVTAPAASGSSGFLKVGAKPPANEIDWGKTGNMIYDSQAVLKNGKKVTWA